MSGNLAIVTGTSRGIGKAIAEQLVGKGWSVIGAARGFAPIEDPGYKHCMVDMADPEALKKWIEEDLHPIVSQGGIERIGLVNNAALIGQLAWIKEGDPAALARLLTVNVASPMHLMGWLVKNTSPDTAVRIVNMSTGAAHSPMPGLSDYSASKAALRLAARTMAVELEVEGRTPAEASVFSYEPGVVDTSMQVAARDTDPNRFPAHYMFNGYSDQGLLNSSKEVAIPVVEFLNSDPGEYFTESRFE